VAAEQAVVELVLEAVVVVQVLLFFQFQHQDILELQQEALQLVHRAHKLLLNLHLAVHIQVNLRGIKNDIFCKSRASNSS